MGGVLCLVIFNFSSYGNHFFFSVTFIKFFGKQPERAGLRAQNQTQY